MASHILTVIGPAGGYGYELVAIFKALKSIGVIAPHHTKKAMNRTLRQLVMDGALRRFNGADGKPIFQRLV
jgi:hypothetical protein